MRSALLDFEIRVCGRLQLAPAVIQGGLGCKPVIDMLSMPTAALQI
jgi:hypothetical protein